MPIMIMMHCVKNVQIRSFFWSVFPRIRTEYGEILRYLVRMRENTDQKKLLIWTFLLSDNEGNTHDEDFDCSDFTKT